MEQTAKAFRPKRALAGKSEDQLLQALQDYKSGKRADAVMKGMAAGLSDQGPPTSRHSSKGYAWCAFGGQR
jgi:cytochrome c553